MKKTIIAALTVMFVSTTCFAQHQQTNKNISSLFNKFWKPDSGVFALIHNDFIKAVRCDTIAPPIVYVKIKEDATVLPEQIEIIHSAIKNAFIKARDDYDVSTKCPYLSGADVYPRRGRKGGDEDAQLVDFLSGDNYVVQELKISSVSNRVVIKAGKAFWRKGLKTAGSVDGTDFQLELTIILPDTRTTKRQSFGVSHKQITQQVDSLAALFRDVHFSQIKQSSPWSYGFDYTEMDDRIFKDYIDSSLQKLASPSDNESFRNFLVRFLGNAGLGYRDKIDDQDFIRTSRLQDSDLSKFENYSFYLISESEKNFQDLEFCPKFPKPDYYEENSTLRFGHYVTVKNSSLREILITYPAERYITDILEPLETIFGDYNGRKYYDDIVRFFFGFTTALTTQDIDRIRTFYHEMAIRSYFPGNSFETTTRDTAFGAGSIAKRFETLRQMSREVYVTLNEGSDTVERFSTAWVSINHNEVADTVSLGQISDNQQRVKEFARLPAFLMFLDMKQRWRTIRRPDQCITLFDTARVDFALLALNIQSMETWLDKNQDHDLLTVFALESYLQDLFGEMYSKEKDDFKRDFRKLWQFLAKNRRIRNRLFATDNPRQLLRFRTLAIDQICHPKRFKDARKQIRDFILFSPLREKVHSRRFLFNTCYLKILGQYTRGNEKNSLIRTGDTLDFGLFKERLRIGNQ